MNPITPSLFSEFDTPQSTAKAAVLVRSHLRHVKGSEKPYSAPQEPQKRTETINGLPRQDSYHSDYISEAPRDPAAEKALASVFGLDSLPPHNGTTTSKSAALAVQSQQATQIERVLQIITQSGARGTTRGDIAHQMGKPQSTICARVSRLLEDGRVRETADPRIPDVGGSVKQKVLVRV